MHDAKKTKAQLFQELAALRQQLAELFENASDAAYTLDLAEHITGVNRAVELLTGYSRTELLDMHVADVLAPEFLERSHQNHPHHGTRGAHPEHTGRWARFA